MDIDRIRELIELMIEKDLAELSIEQHGVSVRLRRPEPALVGAAPVFAQPIAAAVVPALATGISADATEVSAAHADAHIVHSPMVGTFYAAPDSEADPFVQVGDAIEEGQTLCIVEAMKLMNEITADVGGEVVAIFPDNAQPVEYGQELFAIRPA